VRPPSQDPPVLFAQPKVLHLLAELAPVERRPQRHLAPLVEVGFGSEAAVLRHRLTEAREEVPGVVVRARALSAEADDRGGEHPQDLIPTDAELDEPVHEATRAEEDFLSRPARRRWLWGRGLGALGRCRLLR